MLYKIFQTSKYGRSDFVDGGVSQFTTWRMLKGKRCQSLYFQQAQALTENDYSDFVATVLSSECTFKQDDAFNSHYKHVHASVNPKKFHTLRTALLVLERSYECGRDASYLLSVSRS
ncbi:hypothetical protein NPIL_253621 [Nephila pilipes]|uniref:Uncharacterized protein n=1 Tax=Nephila pilipes TaxID=299642 RepID=A0A8X6TUX0_NEPPI|nr:hypothetical protein NPIL_253621 [Nephila pilipes]